MAFLWRMIGGIFNPNQEGTKKTRKSKGLNHRHQNKSKLDSSGYQDFIQTVVDTHENSQSNGRRYPRHSFDSVEFNDPMTPSPMVRRPNKPTSSRQKNFAEPIKNLREQSLQRFTSAEFVDHIEPLYQAPVSKNSLPKLRGRSSEFLGTNAAKDTAPPQSNKEVKRALTATRRGSKWLYEYQSHAHTSVNSFIPSFEDPSTATIAQSQLPTSWDQKAELSTPNQVIPKSIPREQKKIESTTRQRSPQRTRNHALNIAKELRARNSGSGDRLSWNSSMLSPRSSIKKTPLSGQISHAHSPILRPVARRLSSSEYLARYGSNEYMSLRPQLTPKQQTQEQSYHTPKSPKEILQQEIQEPVTPKILQRKSRQLIHRTPSLPQPLNPQRLQQHSNELPRRSPSLPETAQRSMDSGVEMLTQFQAIRSRTNPSLARKQSADLMTRLNEAAERVPQVTLLPTGPKTPRAKTPKTNKRVRFTD